MITIERFNEKYKHYGGYAKLNEMMHDLKTQEDICKQFKVGRMTVRGWTKRIFGQTYDPRAARRKRRVKYIYDYMKKHSLYASKEMFKYENQDYFREALNLAKREGIYPEAEETPSSPFSL